MGCSSSSAGGTTGGAITIKSFSLERVIGQGGFGKVNAVVKLDEKKWYAMKTLTKKVVVDSKNIEMLMNERGLLIELKCVFLCNMHHAFQDPHNCYIVMDLCLGGDLRYHLNKNPQIYTEEACKFYTASILLGLKYLHFNNCLHRDIKPDNMLLDSEGYLKITDLGISSKMTNGLSDKRSGTKPYMAFELFNKIPHGIPSDLYSVSVMLFELLNKSRPWKDATDASSMFPKQVTEKLTVSSDCKDILNKGLCREAKDRFQTADEMMGHAWFSGFDWAGLKARTLKAPFQPNIDVANCDTGTNDLSDAFGIEDEPKKINEADQAQFAGYNYRDTKENSGPATTESKYYVEPTTAGTPSSNPQRRHEVKINPFYIPVNSMPQKTFKNLLDFLSSLPKETTERLWMKPWVVNAVIPLLSPLLKQVIFRWIFAYEEKFTISVIKSWFSLTEDQVKEIVLDPLENAYIINYTYDSANSRNVNLIKVQINSNFCESLRSGLKGECKYPWPVSSNKGGGKDKLSVKQVEDHGRKSWNQVREFLVDPSYNIKSDVVRHIKDLMEGAGLVKFLAESSKTVVSTHGYEFVLKDSSQQVWVIICEYLLKVSNGFKTEELIETICKLSMCILGESYSKKSFTVDQNAFLHDLAQMGLVVIIEREKGSRFYPTSLAINMIHGESFHHCSAVNKSGLQDEVTETKVSELSLLIETNFRVYAYTTSPLHLKMLELFIELELQLPNMVLGTITRDSIRRSLQNDVKADQIIDFLQSHAHPRMHLNYPILPENVTDQIHLWQSERNVLDPHDATIITEFDGKDEYNELLQFAIDNECLLWKEPLWIEGSSNMKLVVSKKGWDESMKTFLVQRKKAGMRSNI